jgi:hypothetical protein
MREFYARRNLAHYAGLISGGRDEMRFDYFNFSTTSISMGFLPLLKSG